MAARSSQGATRFSGKTPDYKSDKEQCKDLLRSFVDADGRMKYLEMLQQVANRKLRSVDISLDDFCNVRCLSFDRFLVLIVSLCLLQDFDAEMLVQRIRTNTKRYLGLFAEAIDEILPDPTVPIDVDDDYEVLMRQRNNDPSENADNADPRQTLPAEIKRYFEVHITALTSEKPRALREVRASHIGQLVKVRGIVTRCSDVKPLIQVAVYTCEECGFEIYQEVTSRTFMPLLECPSTRCRTNNVKGRLILQLRASKFLKFQEAKIQELAEHVPKGHIPRSMTINIRGELTRQLGPGDLVEISGIFLPVPFTGFRAIRAGLVADTYLEAMSIKHTKKRYEEYVLSGIEQDTIEALAQDGQIYDRLSFSIAPEIFGHDDVKKALLLVLVGAPTRHLKDGMKIRGDLHVCLMGDPGVAKSQLLKHMVTIAPRGVYTTGRGSSGVGLTAAVHRDPVTNEMVLEGGALVLADMGICAIDEFDKMDETDRTSIHEVMEQQTVSIAKAGITTSLNARTAILAAANPAWGRYDMRRTPAENINLPPALLSRFDLMWLILDRADREIDSAMATHVLHVHTHGVPPPTAGNPLEPSMLRAYVAMARRVVPFVPRTLTEYISSAYAALRQEEAQSNAPHSYTTARTLLSIMRISEALARLRFSTTVVQSDVDEALRLMQMSKFSVYADDQRKTGLDPISTIYTIIRDESARLRTLRLKYGDVLNQISVKGYKEAQLRQCLEEYAALNVWQLDPQTLDIQFVDV
ncbi:DNA replication licensing factor MCM7 isoform X1 [Selaginella moellendorffii]|uniref:DNA replication licensing factor MCM7 isoform X1 n=1 Tax=Selaginella moellendorffii TaxID=88036 RepID=UPI000D1CFD76|nr:DNA replication licensing factor MCM7 isoform X1 [Selaginella moellendorffii]|eukprot:XP_024527474.1 DNA replication licensing factor MCM7 isoform X1 [Selaginella moellendorffii]